MLHVIFLSFFSVTARAELGLSYSFRLEGAGDNQKKNDYPYTGVLSCSFDAGKILGK